jgi:2-hydroxy-6-oxonona-2,4-dienedioate hydrolase
MSEAATAAPPALTLESSTRTVQTKRWKLQYYEAGTGHPVILLHGTGPGATGWSNFNPNIAELSKTYRVIALDLPGWGGSDSMDPTQEPRQKAHVEAVRMLMDELGLQTAALVGNSMGGGVTLEFAATYNDRISHCITMGSGIFAIPNVFMPGGVSEGVRIIRETYEEPTPENFRRLVQVMVYDPSFATDELLNARSKAALANQEHLDNWLKPFRAAAAGPPAIPSEMVGKLATMKTPALFIHGRDDRVVSMESSLRTVATVPNSRLHVFNRCGHWAQIEHAREFNALVHSFISLN